MKMKKHLAMLFLSAACSLFAQKYLYTVELSPENLADIDPRQNTVLKTVENKKAIFITKGNSIWLDLTLEKCLGEEITVTFRYKAADPAKTSKKATASLRYAKGDVYCDSTVVKSIKLAPGKEWQTATCTGIFPKKMEEAMVVLSTDDNNFYVTDIKVYRKGK